MTTAEKLAEVTAQIRKDIPRLMELKEGCYLKHNIASSIYKIYCVDHYNYHLFRPSDKKTWILSKEILEKSLLKKEIFEIIGHDIMLNDILEWSLMNKLFNIELIHKTLRIKPFKNLLHLNDYGRWDLSKPYLKDQSEELLKFLYNIIKDE